MMVRALIRRLVPLSLRQDIRQLWRTHMDDWRGLRFTRARGEIVSSSPIRLAQTIRQSSLYQNKLTNLRRAAALLDGQLIEPGAHWSFWHAIGRPDACNGFVVGRNLVGGRLVEQTGGGLCQMASLVYHLALLAGLGIRERHAHSVDIYREEERFTPLGADATVVWGFKDLRLTNPHGFPLVLRVRVADGGPGGKLSGEFYAQGMLVGRSVEFVREAFAPGQVRVHTLTGGVVLDVTEYRQMPGILAAQPAFV